VPPNWGVGNLISSARMLGVEPIWEVFRSWGFHLHEQSNAFIKVLNCHVRRVFLPSGGCSSQGTVLVAECSPHQTLANTLILALPHWRMTSSKYLFSHYSSTKWTKQWGVAITST
jgi:hypothetical protein